MFLINLFFFQIGSELTTEIHVANNSADIENEGKRAFFTFRH